MNKFLLISDTSTFASELKKTLETLAPKAMILESGPADVEMFASSFDDPGCVTFYESETSAEVFEGRTVKGLCIAFQNSTNPKPNHAQGILYSDLSLESQLPNLKTFLNFSLFKKEEHKIDGIENILTTLSERMGQELKRVKKLHEKLVNFRSEEYKGVNVTSKFASGEKSGGEFFDVVSTKRGPIFILSSTNSYVASSIIMSQLESIYQSKEYSLEIVSRVMSVIEKEFLALGLDLSVCGLMIMELELASMKLRTFSFGGVRFYIEGRESFHSKALKLPVSDCTPYMWEGRLARAESLVVLSPGFYKNMGGGNESEFLGLMKEGARDFLTKAFFELKKDRSSSFLEYDAAAIYFEVDQNAILQV